MNTNNESIHLPAIRFRKPASQESWYSLWCSLCLIEPLSTKEIRQLLFSLSTRNMLDPTSFRTERPELKVLNTAFGVTSETVAVLGGADMDNEPRSTGHMHVGLRHCPVCLSNGYHSPVFQHLSIHTCPLHEVPLRTACQNCNAELNPTWLVAGTNPFGCPRCDAMFVRSVERPQQTSEILLVDMLLATRREVIVHDRQTASRVRPCTLPTVRSSKDDQSTTTRYVQRQAIWMNMPREGWLQFKGTTLQLRENENVKITGLEGVGSVEIAIRKTLTRIRDLFEDDEAELHELQAILGRFEGGRRLIDTAGVVTCAILKTEYLLGVAARVAVQPVLSPLDLVKTRDPRCQAEQSGAPLVKFVEANALLVEYEVLGLFCLHVWRIARLKRLTDIAWNEFSHAAHFRPEWCLDEHHTVPLLYIRPRATWKTVQFLIKRYSKRLLR
ncbi:hypothetical protein [Paraburkholderia sp. C35]|uniref:hypothetical protein n=1 Tax=Paraburkholderia sp. C35 TaxID=2126993 RepID=UPI0013A5A1E1|nr:hypothetical protein [Paraburkholderia sp. C35]